MITLVDDLPVKGEHIRHSMHSHKKSGKSCSTDSIFVQEYREVLQRETINQTSPSPASRSWHVSDALHPRWLQPVLWSRPLPFSHLPLSQTAHRAVTSLTRWLRFHPDYMNFHSPWEVTVVPGELQVSLWMQSGGAEPLLTAPDPPTSIFISAAAPLMLWLTAFGRVKMCVWKTAHFHRNKKEIMHELQSLRLLFVTRAVVQVTFEEILRLGSCQHHFVLLPCKREFDTHLFLTRANQCDGKALLSMY